MELAKVWTALATGLGISYIAPSRAGKWTGAGFLGSLEGAALWPLLPASAAAFSGTVGVAILAACWICGRAESALGVKDDPRIVLDEVVGMWVAAAGMPRRFLPILAAFALFRLFDSVKWPPVSWLERLPGGWGIVLDDVGAGAIANVIARAFLHHWSWA